MKPILSAFSLVVLFTIVCISRLMAQNSSAPWSNWQQHPCYKGISVSVKNMGYNKDNNSYYWGVRIQNNYGKPLVFRYLLSVGGEKEGVTKYYYQVSGMLQPAGIWTDGADVFTANMFKSSSDQWVVKIIDACFDGMRCGGNDNCYAACDVEEKKINQPCGLSGDQGVQANNNSGNIFTEVGGTVSANDQQNARSNYSGQYIQWMQEGNDVAFTIGKTDTAVFWKKKEGEPPVVFKLLIPGVYRYDMGQDFMMIKFESGDRLSLWNNGNLVGYFKRPGNAKQEVTEKVVLNKQEEKSVPDASKGVSIFNLNGKWKASYDGNLSSSIIVSNENEFVWDWVVSAFIKVKGETHFKRQSGNVFVTERKNGLGQWCRIEITYISDDKLGIQFFKCSGKLINSGELNRVSN